MNLKKLRIDIGKRIRKYRKRKGLTQKELAERIGVNHSYVSKWEKGRIGKGVGPSEQVIEKLIREFRNTGRKEGVDQLYKDLMIATGRIPYLPKLREIVFNEPEEYYDFLQRHSQTTATTTPGTIERTPLSLIKELAEEEKIKDENS